MASETARDKTTPTDTSTEADYPAPLEPTLTDDGDDDIEEEIRRREESLDERANRDELKRTQSYATDTSTITRTTTRASVPAAPKKPWYKTPNPLMWGSIPPVPNEKQESGEAKAGFFSLLTFHWMTPLMNVSATGNKGQERAQCAPKAATTNLGLSLIEFRLATSDHWSKAICGR